MDPKKEVIRDGKRVAGSSHATKSVKGKEKEIEQVDQTSDTDPVKGKEVTTKRGTRPPLNYQAILRDANVIIDTSSIEKLCDRLYAGVILEPGKSKYFVDKNLNKNCFMVFARKLSIRWVENSENWKWTKDKDSSGEDIEVAELLGVQSLEIQGKIKTIDLSPGTKYEIVFVVMMKDKGHPNMKKYSPTLTITPPRSKCVTRNENLKEKPFGKWFEIQVGEFITSPENVGEIIFNLVENSQDMKKGLVLKCAIIRPK